MYTGTQFILVGALCVPAVLSSFMFSVLFIVFTFPVYANKKCGHRTKHKGSLRREMEVIRRRTDRKEKIRSDVI